MTNKDKLSAAKRCLHSRIEDLRHEIEKTNIGEETTTLENILEIKYMRCIDILLSWGGPSEWIRAIIDGDDIKDASFHYADWFFHCEVEMNDDQQDTLNTWLADFILPLLDHYGGQGNA